MFLVISLEEEVIGFNKAIILHETFNTLGHSLKG